MGWLSGLWKKQLEPSWEYRTDGVIWRLVPSMNGLFVGEERDVDSKSVSFFCIEQRTGRTLWEDVRMAESWWITIGAIHEEVVLLHEYSTPDLPEHKHIVALEAFTGKVMWSNNELKLLFVHNNALFASLDHYESRSFYELDIFTGAILREVTSDYIGVFRDTILPQSSAFIAFPCQCSPDIEISPEWRQTVDRVTKNASDVIFAECLEGEGTLTVSYFDNTSRNPSVPSLNQHLVIFDQQREAVLFDDVLTTQGRSPVPDTFFGIDDFIYYIKDRKVLRAINLSTQGESYGKNPR